MKKIITSALLTFTSFLAYSQTYIFKHITMYEDSVLTIDDFYQGEIELMEKFIVLSIPELNVFSRFSIEEHTTSKEMYGMLETYICKSEKGEVNAILFLMETGSISLSTATRFLHLEQIEIKP